MMPVESIAVPGVLRAVLYAGTRRVGREDRIVAEAAELDQANEQEDQHGQHDRELDRLVPLSDRARA